MCPMSALVKSANLTARRPLSGTHSTDTIRPTRLVRLVPQEETHAPQQCAASDQASEQRYDSLRLMRLPQAKGHGLCIGGFEGSVVCIATETLPFVGQHDSVKWCSARPDLTGDMRSIR